MIRVGTRGSVLALTQARWVAERVAAETELVTINATGPIDDKSRWVSELERALVEERIDIAVHSAKDVPTQLPPGLELIAIPPREDPHDAICGAPSLTALPSGARVGTSSLRRSAQVRALRPDLEVLPIRGNVDTRLRKLRDGECDALVLAAAGLHRLGLQPDGVLEDLVPAAGQGALAIEARSGTTAARARGLRGDAGGDGRARARPRAGRLVQHAGGGPRAGGRRRPAGAIGLGGTSRRHGMVERQIVWRPR